MAVLGGDGAGGRHPVAHGGGSDQHAEQGQERGPAGVERQQVQRGQEEERGQESARNATGPVIAGGERERCGYSVEARAIC